jgi:hypothetical protein
MPGDGWIPPDERLSLPIEEPSIAGKQLTAVYDLKLAPSESNIRINIGAADRPFEINFTDGTKIEQDFGSKKIAITRGAEYVVAVNDLQLEASESAIRIKIDATDRPTEINFSDGAKIVHANGSKVIVITRGAEYVVTGRHTKRIRER